MAWSTRMPMEMVMPASDMMLAWMSMMPSCRSSHIIRNENSTASGKRDADHEHAADVHQDQQNGQRRR